MNIVYLRVEDVESRFKELRLQKSRLEEESKLLETVKQDLLSHDESQRFSHLIDSANSRIREILESAGFNGLVLPRIEIVEQMSSGNLDDPEITADLKTFENKVLIRFSNHSSLLEDWMEFIIKHIVPLQNLMIAYGEDLIDFSSRDRMNFKIEDVDITVNLCRDRNGQVTDSFSISAHRLMFRDCENTDQSLISISDHASVTASYDYLDLKFEYFVRHTSLDSIERWIERILEDHDKAKESLLV